MGDRAIPAAAGDVAVLAFSCLFGYEEEEGRVGALTLGPVLYCTYFVLLPVPARQPAARKYPQSPPPLPPSHHHCHHPQSHPPLGLGRLYRPATILVSGEFRFREAGHAIGGRPGPAGLDLAAQYEARLR